MGRARRYASRARNFSPRSRGGFNTNNILNGALGGAAATVGAQYLGPTYGPAAGLMAVGWFRKDPVLQTMAGVAIGSQLGGMLSLPGAANPGASGTVL